MHTAYIRDPLQPSRLSTSKFKILYTCHMIEPGAFGRAIFLHRQGNFQIPGILKASGCRLLLEILNTSNVGAELGQQLPMLGAEFFVLKKPRSLIPQPYPKPETLNPKP